MKTPAMTYFTDLAELVSRIDKPQSRFYLGDNESEAVTDDDESYPRLDAEDDEYMYDDDIIMEESSDELDDNDKDDGHFPESDKVYQTTSEPVFKSRDLEGGRRSGFTGAAGLVHRKTPKGEGGSQNAGRSKSTGRIVEGDPHQSL
ncbi:hypothetical protein ACOMHN_064496 [Nucella lapillus]